jgi:hypothetical protein
MSVSQEQARHLGVSPPYPADQIVECEQDPANWHTLAIIRPIGTWTDHQVQELMAYLRRHQPASVALKLDESLRAGRNAQPPQASPQRYSTWAAPIRVPATAFDPAPAVPAQPTPATARSAQVQPATVRAPLLRAAPGRCECGSGNHTRGPAHDSWCQLLERTTESPPRGPCICNYPDARATSPGPGHRLGCPWCAAR